MLPVGPGESQILPSINVCRPLARIAFGATCVYLAEESRVNWGTPSARRTSNRIRCQYVAVNLAEIAYCHDLFYDRQGDSDILASSKRNIAYSMFFVSEVGDPVESSTASSSSRLSRVWGCASFLTSCFCIYYSMENWHNPKWTSIGSENATRGSFSTAERHASYVPILQ